MVQERANNWWVQGFMMLALLFVGIVAGVTLESAEPQMLL